MKPIDVICALNDVDDEYILHAMNPSRRRVVNIRRVLIAAIIVILAVVCATSIYSSKTFRYGIKTATDDPVDSALNYLESLADEDYVSTIEVYGGMIYDQRTAEVLEYWDNVVDERDWNEDNFVVVYTEYYVEYIHDMVPYNDGYTARTFWMEYDEATNAWYYYDGMSGIPFLGIFEEDGLGHDGWTKDDVAAYNAATAYLEENFAEVEICGYKLDDSKALEVIGDYSELAEERGWRWTQWTTYDYTFLVVYAEYYADYEYSAVWLWMEKDLDTGEWSCYKADTDVELEYVYVDDPNVQERNSEYEEGAQVAVIAVIESLKDGDEIVSVEIYGSKIESSETQITLDKATVLIYAEYCVEYADGKTNDNAVYFWMERDADSGEWSCYSTVDVTTSSYEFLYK